MVSTLPLLIPAAVAAGYALEIVASRRDERRFPPPGQRIDVGTHTLHARILGSGDPVVVLEAGAGEWCSHWDRIPESLSNHTTVIAYDRAGLGWSDPGFGARTVEAQALELRQLVRQVAPDRPVVLVAHSVGSHVLRMFAHRYPHDVVGLVIVDGYHEALEEELARAGIPSPRMSTWMLRATVLAAHLGVLRALRISPLGAPANDLDLPAATLQVLHALGRSRRVLDGMLAEHRAALASDSVVAGLRVELDVPARILVAGESLSAAGVPDSYPRAEFNRVWREVSARLASLSSRAQVRIIEGAGHLLPLHSPQLVVQAVREVLDEVAATSGVDLSTG